MQVEVNPTGWEPQVDEIHALLTDVVGQFLRYFAQPPSGGIRVQFRSHHCPMIDFRSSPSDPFPIWLCATDRFWPQFIYEFAHEFCHILCDYERRRCNSNHWIQEALCEVAALFALRQMAISWPSAAPYPNWRGDAPRLNAYADEVVARQQRLPNGVTLRNWLRDNEATLRANPYERSLTGLIAVHFLPLFQRSPPSWQSVWYLPNSNETFDKVLAEWHGSCPSEQRGFVVQIADLFGISFGNKV